MEVLLLIGILQRLICYYTTGDVGLWTITFLWRYAMPDPSLLLCLIEIGKCVVRIEIS